MSTASNLSGPTPSPIPVLRQITQDPNSDSNNASRDAYDAHHLSTTLASRPHVPKPSWPQPRLRLEIQDLAHPAALLFSRAFIASSFLSEVIDAVLTSLYGSDPASASGRPAVRSITFVFRAMDGVAYTCGNDELGDGDHKQIHFNLNHITNVMDGARKEAEERKRKRQDGGEMAVDGDEGRDDEDPDKVAAKRGAAEFHGVLVHEMVHCWQWNGMGAAPGGLVEGVADYVRLKEGLAPPHWNRKDKGAKWDGGYQTTAYFLEWCEREAGEGKVRELNAWLGKNKYNGDDAWQTVFGRDVAQLWKEYTSSEY